MYVHTSYCTASVCYTVIVTCPAKIDHVSGNYTKLVFADIFSPECDIPFP